MNNELKKHLTIGLRLSRQRGIILFSKRKKLAERAIEWCEKKGAPLNPFNIVTALNAIGALKMPEDEKEKEDS